MKLINIIVIVFFVILLLTGCYSFVSIEREQYKNIKMDDVLEIYLNNGKCDKIDAIQKIRMNEYQMEIITQDTLHSKYIFSEIQEIRVRKHDPFKSDLSAVSFGLITGVVALGTVVYIFYSTMAKNTGK